MDAQLIQELNTQLKGLATSLTDEFTKGMNDRDVALCERLGKMIDDKIKAANAIVAEENKRYAVPGLTADSPEVKQFSFAKLVKGALLRNPAKYCPLELEMCTAAADQLNGGMQETIERTGHAPVTRDMATNPDPAGGYIVPIQVMSAQIIPLLQPQVTLMSLGVQQMTGLNGIVEFIKLKTGSTAYHINHDKVSGATAPTKSDLAFDLIEMRPHAAAARTILSNRLITQSTPAAEGVVKGQISRDLALLMDRDGYQGTGTNGEPRGIVDQSGVGVVTSFGALSAATAYDKMIEMIYAVQAANALFGKLGWAMHPAALREIRQMLDPNDNTQPKARRLIDGDVPKSILGYPFQVTTQFPTNQLMFGAWDQFAFGQWGTMLLAVDSLTVLGLLQTQILAAVEYDFALFQPSAFCQTASLTGAS